jgi:hypothetical protein
MISWKNANNPNWDTTKKFQMGQVLTLRWAPNNAITYVNICRRGKHDYSYHFGWKQNRTNQWN